ncbi:MAG TPA: FAD-dependent oxidoreductase, partial [Campylobacterales bacterium]|nr:FAD-dependent oxidoreductase [Campylobacterales bacterium]
MLKENVKIAIIGGGVAGATTAITLGQLGINVTLFEKESSLVSGPPFCHLHAGGNLYREISDAQCVTLLKQSIDFLRFYPYVVDYRPTVIALPTTDKSTVKALLPRLDLLVKEYEKLIQSDENNKVLGESKNYYKLYEREELEAFQNMSTLSIPTNSDEWMIPVAKNIDLDKVQFPLILVQEYGLNLFRLAAGTMLTLKEIPNVTLQMETMVQDIHKKENGWNIFSIKNEHQHYNDDFDYIINAAGFRVGKIDDMINAPCKRMVEFKAAYVSKCTGLSDTL